MAEWERVLEIAAQLSAVLAIPVSIWVAVKTSKTAHEASDIGKLLRQHQQQSQEQKQEVHVHYDWAGHPRGQSGSHPEQ